MIAETLDTLVGAFPELEGWRVRKEPEDDGVYVVEILIGGERLASRSKKMRDAMLGACGVTIEVVAQMRAESGGADGS